MSSPGEAGLDVRVVNDVSVPAVDDDRSDRVTRDDDPHSMVVDDAVVSKVCSYIYFVSTLLLVFVFRVDVFVCEPSLAKLYSLI